MVSSRRRRAVAVAALLGSFASLAAMGLASAAQAPDTTPPDTFIDGGPSGTVEDDSATFTFSADEGGTSFECSKEGRPYVSCTSPQKYYGYKDGDHSFAVRANDATGNVDPTPATRTWTVRQAASTSTTTTAPAPTTTTTPTTTAPADSDALPAIVVSPPATPPPATPRTSKEKGGRAQPSTRSSTSTSSSTTTTEVTVVVHDPTPAIVLPPPRSDSAEAVERTASDGDNLAAGDARQPRRRISSRAVTRLGLVLTLLVAGALGLWWTRPRYDPA